MAEIRDPAIKLFGKTIPLSESGDKSPDPASSLPEDTCEDTGHIEVESQRADPAEEPSDPDCSASLNNAEEDNDQDYANEKKSMMDSKLEEDQTTTDAPDQEKAVKKPDRILPCPRCNSLETKFCYFNNYNVNQPRHFCKNCQRYWTAGGTMRNVPVGAGRRKNKHVASHYRHIIMTSNGLPNTRVDSSEVSHHQVLPCGGLPAPLGPLKGNGTILKFGPDAPLCESMATVLNLGEHKRTGETVSMTCGNSGEESTSQSLVAASACLDKELPRHTGQMEPGPVPGFSNEVMPPPSVPCYGGPPWPFAWSPIWSGIAPMAPGQCSSVPISRQDTSNSTSVQWGLPPMMVPPAFCAPSVPFPFVPAPASYWGCMPGWAGGPWSRPWIPPNGGVSPSSSSNSGCSGNGSPTLGKHSRDGNLPPEEKPEKFLWVPKTLRIDDPDEAAKSSIWATLGFKPDTNEPIIKGGIFKAFRPNVEGQDRASDASQLLQANPAALSRSQTFQENTT